MMSCMSMRSLLLLSPLTLSPSLASQAQMSVPEPGEALPVATVWSGHPVGFCLLTHEHVQLVAYYDAERRMSVARRRLDERDWQVQVLPSRLGWDSHNYVTMALDRRGNVHVCGNLHGDPLVYFRTRKPLDIASFEPVDEMVGEREQRMTYPTFLQAADGKLLFRYRDGGSGRGDDLLNVYDERRRRWRRLVDEPLVAGGGEVSGYFAKPQRGPDGRFHIVGIWRDTPDCATNHDVSYACSDDLKVWRRADGRRLRLPLTPDGIDVVDPVPARGGAINGNVKLGFDGSERPIVSYHKYDEHGHTQVYCARFESGQWRVRQVGDLGGYRWDFGGGGAIGFDVHVASVRIVDEHHLAQAVTFPGGSRDWLLDADTLEVVGDAEPQPAAVPSQWRRVESDFAGMQKRVAHDSGNAPDGVRYVLTWETLPANRDRPRQGPLPGPSQLRVVALPR